MVKKKKEVKKTNNVRDKKGQERREKEKGKRKCYWGCLLFCTSLELSTVYNALEVLLLRDG